MSHGHIYAVASGFGFRLIPKFAPYQFRLGPEPNQIDTKCFFPEGSKFCRLTPNGEHFRSDVGGSTQSFKEVVSVEQGPTWTEWWIETTHYRVPLPEYWNVHCEGDGANPSLFELIGPNESLIYVQTPKNAPTPDTLVAPGQHLRAQGKATRSRWVELEYVHDGQGWVQRYEWLKLGRLNAVITMQALVADAALHLPVLHDIVQRIERTSEA